MPNKTGFIRGARIARIIGVLAVVLLTAGRAKIKRASPARRSQAASRISWSMSATGSSLNPIRPS
jgi:hypothetical protein